MSQFICLFVGCCLLLKVDFIAAQTVASSPGTPPSASGRSAVTRASLGEFLAQRRQEQLGLIKGCSAFYDFQFADRLPESEIRFEHRVVDDAGKYYKAVHYDHGNAVAVADIDGDGLTDIYFTTQLGTNQLWRNKGGGKFEDYTLRSGLGLPDQVSVGASFADIDNDGDPDLFVTTVRNGNHLFENLGGGQFRDLTQAAGLAYQGHSSGAVFFDYDRDGFLDLFLCNVGVYTTQKIGRGPYFIGLPDAFSGHLYPERAEACILYKNLDGHRFKDVTAAMRLNGGGWVGDASFTDINQDGYPDLMALNMQGASHYYENQAGQGFTDKTPAYFPKTPWGAMGIKFFDWNQDGLMDLFITDMHSDMTYPATKISESNFRVNFEKRKSEDWCTAQYDDNYLQGANTKVFGNAFYQNQGKGVFAEISDAIGAETFWPWGISVGDLNADGYEDVVVSSGMGLGFRYGINPVLLNDQGRRFFDSEFVLGIEPRRDRRTHKVAFVLDCNGTDKDSPFCSGRSGTITVMEALSSRSAAIFDLDNDGDLDVITLDMNTHPQVLLSNLTEKKDIHYLKIKLTGKTSNRDGLGARVTVTAKGKTLTQIYDGKSGYFAQSSLPLYFGLGSAETVDQIEVRWPSGKVQHLSQGLTINKQVTIEE